MEIIELGKKYELLADTLRCYEQIGLINGVNHNKCRVRKILRNNE